MDFDPDAYLAAPPAAAGAGFDPDSYLASKPVAPTLPPEAPSMASAAMRGAAQGASFGLADELTAGVGAGIDKVQSLLGQRGDISLGDAYDTRLQAIREADHAAEAANPATYNISQFAGGVAPGLLTGGTSALNTVGGLAAQGGLQGFGASEAEDLGGLVLDTAKGALLGGGVGAAAKGIQKAAAPAGRAVKEGLEDVANTTFRPTADGPVREAKGLVSKAIKGIADAGDYVTNLNKKMAEDLGGQVLQGGVGFNIPTAARVASNAYKPLQAAARMTLEQVIPRMGKYSKVLSDAAQRGGTSLAASHFVLQQQDPEYRRKLQEAGFLENQN